MGRARLGEIVRLLLLGKIKAQGQPQHEFVGFLTNEIKD